MAKIPPKTPTPSIPYEGGGLRAHLIRGASASFLLQIGFAGISFLNGAVLARWLGPAGFGAYSGAVAWMGLLLTPALLGFDNLLVRDGSIYRSQQDWSKLKGLLYFSMIATLPVSILLAIILTSIAHWGILELEKQPLREAMYLASLLLPVTVLLTLVASALRGLERVVLANLPTQIIRPALLLLGILLFATLWPERLSAPMAMALNTGATIIALFVGFVWLRNNDNSPIWRAPPDYQYRRWLVAALPMLIYSGSQSVLGQTDIAMLTAMRGMSEAGLYAAANRLALLLVFVTLATGMILAPVIARLYQAGEMERLQKLVTQASRISFIAVFPFGLALVFLGDWALAIFGEEFIAGQSVLVILTIGRMADVAAGAGALLLVMTGHERLTAALFTIAALSNIALNALLIPGYGAMGAAIASVISLLFVKLALLLYAAKRTGLDVSIVGSRLGLKLGQLSGAR